MIKLFTSLCIHAPASVVWAKLAKLDDIQFWSEPVLAAYCEPGREHGVGAERICTLAGNLTIREHCLEWQEGSLLMYEGYGIPFIARATNRFRVIPQGENALVTSEATLVLRYGILGKVLAPLLGMWLRRMAPQSLAGFKYWVEHGKPFAGRVAALPRVAPAC